MTARLVGLGENAILSIRFQSLSGVEIKKKGFFGKGLSEGKSGEEQEESFHGIEGQKKARTNAGPEEVRNRMIISELFALR